MPDSPVKTKKTTKAWNVIQSHQKELCLKDSVIKEIMTSMVMHAQPHEKINGFAKVNNTAATYDGLIIANCGQGDLQGRASEVYWRELEEFDKAWFDLVQHVRLPSEQGPEQKVGWRKF